MNYLDQVEKNLLREVVPAAIKENPVAPAAKEKSNVIQLAQAVQKKAFEPQQRKEEKISGSNLSACKRLLIDMCSDRLSFNEFSHTTLFDNKELDEDAIGELHEILEPFANFRLDIIAKAATLASKLNSFHPIKDFLNSSAAKVKELGLSSERIHEICETWLVNYAGADDCTINREISKRWLVSAVARIMKPGCKADCMLILEGSQGIGKSTLLETLALSSKHFTDKIASISSKDCFLQLDRAWIVELSELDSFRKSEITELKIFLTSTEDTFRKPYATTTTTNERHCIFAGTTNDSTYLSDTTGNRRFWPVKCSEIDIPAVKQNLDLLWGCAAILFESGEKWWLDSNSEKLMREITESRRVMPQWEVDLRDFIDNTNKDFYSNTELKDELQGFDLNRKSNKREMTNVLQSMGYVPHRKNSSRGFARAIK